MAEGLLYRDLVIVAVGTGLRWSELAGLELLIRRAWTTRAEFASAVFEWIEAF